MSDDLEKQSSTPHGADQFATQGVPSSRRSEEASGADQFATGGVIPESSASSSFLQVGEQIAGRYVVLRLLGVGAMGQVYLVRDQLRDEELALKRLQPHLSRDASFRKRFMEEIRLAERLHHPGFLRIRGVDQDSTRGDLFYLMEYLPGETLQTRLERKQQPPFSLDQALALLGPLAEAIDALHQTGVLHRDLKPSNIYLPEHGSPRLMDLGIARALEETSKSALPTGAGIGTAYYMAPEQLRGEALSPASDIFALGIVAYQMLTGTLPIGIPKPPSRLVSALPSSIDQVLFQAIDADPQERYATATAFVKALQENSVPSAAPSSSRPLRAAPREAAGAQYRAPHPPKTSSQPPPPTKHPRFGLYVALCLMLLLGTLAFWWFQHSSISPPPRPMQVSPTVRPSAIRKFLWNFSRSTQTQSNSGTKQIPVELPPERAAQKIGFSIPSAELKVYRSSAFFQIKGILQNLHPQQLLWSVKLQLDLLDQSGKILHSRSLLALQTHEAALCSQDPHRFSTLLRSSPHVHRARLRISFVERNPGIGRPIPQCNRPLQPAIWQWAAPPPEGFQIDLKLRPDHPKNRHYSKYFRKVFGEREYLYLTWRVTNTGKQPIQMLQLEARFLDAKGKHVIEPKGMYAVTSQKSPIAPGQYALFDTIAHLPKTFHHVELVVQEVR